MPSDGGLRYWNVQGSVRISRSLRRQRGVSHREPLARLSLSVPNDRKSERRMLHTSMCRQFGLHFQRAMRAEQVRRSLQVTNGLRSQQPVHGGQSPRCVQLPERIHRKPDPRMRGRRLLHVGSAVSNVTELRGRNLRIQMFQQSRLSGLAAMHRRQMSTGLQ